MPVMDKKCILSFAIEPVEVLLLDYSLGLPPEAGGLPAQPPAHRRAVWLWRSDLILKRLLLGGE